MCASSLSLIRTPSKRKVFKGLCLGVTVGLACAFAPFALRLFSGSSDGPPLRELARCPYSPVARALGLPPDASAEVAADKLRVIARWDPPKENATGESRRTFGHRTAEEKIHEALLLVDKYINKTQHGRPPGLKEMMKWESIQAALGKIFPREKSQHFDPLGVLRSEGEPAAEELVRWCEGLDRFTCISILCAFNRLNQISEHAARRITSYFADYPPEDIPRERAELLKKVFSLAESQPVRDACKVKEQYPFPLFFAQGETELLASLKDLLTVLCQICYGRQVTSWQEASGLLGNAGEGSSCDALIKEAKTRERAARDAQLKQGWQILADVLEGVREECRSFRSSH